MIIQDDSPPFDSTRKALVFAFNALDTTIPSPAMNRAMAEINIAIKKCERAAGRTGDYLGDKKMSALRQPGDVLRGLEKAHQAGFILQQVGRLDPRHQNVLAARLTAPTLPCLCGARCCRGFYVHHKWANAIHSLCEVLKESGDVLRQPGRRGLSTEPRLRRLIVERFFVPEHQGSISLLARKGEVSPLTAAKHESWISDYLTQTEGEAWVEIDDIFDQVGITGLIE